VSTRIEADTVTRRGCLGPSAGFRAGLYAGVLFGVLGLVAALTRRPFIFPSLGPTAFMMAVQGRGEETAPRRVILGHAIGALAGLVAYALLVRNGSLGTSLETGSPGLFVLASSGTVSVALTTWGMITSDTRHPPACATTLIVSLGILSTPADVGFILLAVLLLSGVHEWVPRAWPPC
jgi:hypothetical protein